MGPFCETKKSKTGSLLYGRRLSRSEQSEPERETERGRNREREEMVLRKAVTKDCPKKVASLIDLVNLPTPLRNFSGQSQMSHVSFFISVWSYIKQHNLQDVNNKNIVNCDDKLKSILLGKPQVELAELPALIKLHFPKVSK
ncbi:SWIB/MDM2 domain superfamily protein [Rhynchospora pubera]|uniref:SWIB/MDM2 domain superfamily protein n=1 Tax=Rhynchospora pubera TaxID=906938 RepID=A0AAV8FEU6_9POAL|nr:SWIB/MDM2 domain superfamily protein [Rhynchospora pubera]KAJ4791824.1 SWIB/MDM2 domain superfamily protein [Rhynchospora pubera]